MVLQPSNDVNELLGIAETTKVGLDAVLSGICAEVTGARYGGSRVKNRKRIDEKLEASPGHISRKPNTVSDYLGARIWVDKPSTMTEVMKLIRWRFDEIVNADNFLKRGKSGGYRAIHLDVRAASGLCLEIQLIPETMERAREVGHRIHEKWRGKKTLTAAEISEMQRDLQRTSELFEQAYREWLARGRP